MIRGTVAARPRRIAQLLQEPGHGLVALGQSRGGPRDRCVAPQLHERRDQTSRAAAGRETRGHIRIELEGDWPAVRDDVEPAVLAEQVGQKRGTIRGHPQSVLPGPSRVVLPGLRRHNSPASQRPPDVSRAYRWPRVSTRPAYEVSAFAASVTTESKGPGTSPSTIVSTVVAQRPAQTRLLWRCGSVSATGSRMNMYTTTRR